MNFTYTNEYRSEFFDQLKRSKKTEAKIKARQIANAMNLARQMEEDCRRRHECALEKLEKREKALKKFKKTGDDKYLRVFND